MKNFFNYATLLVALLFLASCDGEDDTILTPNRPFATVTANPDSFNNGDTLAIGDTLILTISVTGNANLASYSILRGQTFLINETNAGGTSLSEFLIDTVIATRAIAGTSIRYRATATDVNGKIGQADYFVNIAPTTPLSAEKDFEWKRVGSNPATGLDKFGLVWDLNQNQKAIVKGTTTSKLVFLTVAQYTSINTQEDLKIAVDAAQGETQYTGVSVDAASMTYNDVLGTKVGDNYFLINVKSSTSVFTTQTTATISGKYKE